MIPREITLEIDSRLANLTALSAAVQGLTSMLDLGEIESYNIQLCLVEAVTNSIVHSYAGEPGHEVSVVVTLDPDRVRLEVIDRGAPVPAEKQNPRFSEPDPADLDSLTEGGRGIGLIRALMDEVEFQRQDGQNRLVMTKHHARARL
jgi:serine/threonine-protein kinase RsbW